MSKEEFQERLRYVLAYKQSFYGDTDALETLCECVYAPGAVDEIMTSPANMLVRFLSPNDEQATIFGAGDIRCISVKQRQVSPLRLAIEFGNVAVVDYLLDLGARVWRSDGMHDDILTVLVDNPLSPFCSTESVSRALNRMLTRSPVAAARLMAASSVSASVFRALQLPSLMTYSQNRLCLTCVRFNIASSKLLLRRLLKCVNVVRSEDILHPHLTNRCVNDKDDGLYSTASIMRDRAFWKTFVAIRRRCDDVCLIFLHCAMPPLIVISIFDHLQLSLSNGNRRLRLSFDELYHNTTRLQKIVAKRKQ